MRISAPPILKDHTSQDGLYWRVRIKCMCVVLMQFIKLVVTCSIHCDRDTRPIFCSLLQPTRLCQYNAIYFFSTQHCIPYSAWVCHMLGDTWLWTRWDRDIKNNSTFLWSQLPYFGVAATVTFFDVYTEAPSEKKLLSLSLTPSLQPQ